MRLIEIGLMEACLHAHSILEFRGSSHASLFSLISRMKGDAAITVLIIPLGSPERYENVHKSSIIKWSLAGGSGHGHHLPAPPKTRDGQPGLNGD